MSTLPLVSIGCAVYNGDQTLERALLPLVRQDYPNLEILVTDDGSTDGSVAICERFAQSDPRVRFHRNARNVGLTRNCNALFREARGKYFMWADQDDFRDVTFVGKAVAALERDPEVVVCQSQTAAFIGDPRDIKYVAALGPVSGVRGLLARYWALLTGYTDFAVYGLIRSDALRRTGLWRDALGSANALAFELLLQGPFLEIPEPLHFYSGRGVRNRLTPAQEYARMNIGRPLPWYYFPFLILARNQSAGILRSAVPVAAKGALLAMLWAHVAMVVGTKAAYRTLHRLTGGRLPGWFTAACDRIADPKPPLHFLGGNADDEALFPKAFTLKGPALRS